jgi:hypothetical protein
VVDVADDVGVGEAGEHLDLVHDWGAHTG